MTISEHSALLGFPGGSDGKQSAYHAGDPGSIPGSWRSPGGGNVSPPTPVFLPGEFHGQRSLVGYSLWGRKESDMTKRLTHSHTHTHTHCLNSLAFIDLIALEPSWGIFPLFPLSCLLMVSSPEIIWQCELTDTLRISNCGPRQQEHPVWRQEQGLQACWVILSLDVLEHSFSAHRLNSSFLSSPIGSESSISHQKAQGNPSSSLVVGGNESRNTVRGRVKMRGQNHHTESSVLAFLFLLKCLYSWPLGYCRFTSW